MRSSIEDFQAYIDQNSHQIEVRNTQGKTPIMVAVEHEWHDVIQLLLSKKVNLLKQESCYGNTALHIAALKGDAIACKLLFNAN